MSNRTKYIAAYGFLVGVLIYVWMRKRSSSKRDVRPSGRIAVGDSHAVGIGRASGLEVDPRLARGGWMASDLISALRVYPIRPDVGSVFLSIGTNGQFSPSDGLEQLVVLMRQSFPNARLFTYKGTYGWSGSRTGSQVLQRMDPYYERLRRSGVNVLTNGLGYFSTDSQAHSVATPQARAVIDEIKSSE